jgi:translation initiation factor 3 subunit E
MATARLDVFPKVVRFLDPHLAIAVLANVRAFSSPCATRPFVPASPHSNPPPFPHRPANKHAQFMRDKGMYDEKSVLSSLLAIAKRTRLGDYVLDLEADLRGGPRPTEEALAAQGRALTAELSRLGEACGPLLAIVGIDEATAQLNELRDSNDFNVEHLAAKHGVTEEHVEALYALARARYECGEYRIALAFLDLYEELRFPHREEVPLEVMWGKLAAAIMAEPQEAEGKAVFFQRADEERARIAAALGAAKAGGGGGGAALSDIKRLQQRTWLLHWSLFLLANFPKRREPLIDFYLADENLSCIALTCPWLLRYVIAAVLPHRKKHVLAKMLFRLLSPEALALKDPFALFLHAILGRFDFEAAQGLLEDCRRAIASDYFLSSMLTPAQFLNAARGFLFDVNCRVHQKIDLR